MLPLIKSSQVVVIIIINIKLGDKRAADFQKMRDEKACDTVYGDGNNVACVRIYLRLPDFLWIRTAFASSYEPTEVICSSKTPTTNLISTSSVCCLTNFTGDCFSLYFQLQQYNSYNSVICAIGAFNLRNCMFYFCQ